MATMTVLTQLVAGSPLCFIFFLSYLQQTHGSELIGGCACPGDTLTYNCTTERGFIIWRGTAFDCPNSANEIILLYYHFLSYYAICNDGAIVAQGISVEGNNYTSQLNVTLTSDTAGKTVECFYGGLNETLQLSTVVPTLGPFSPPNKFYSSTDLSLRKVTFTWSPLAPDCPAVHYNILASNCGSCPTTTNHTTVTCTDIPINGSVCTFAVQTVVCGNITGNFSNPVDVNTGVLDHAVQSECNSDTATAHYIASISALATALIICVLVSITAIVIILTRSKAKLKAAFELQQTSRAQGTTHLEPMYEDIAGPLPSISAISTQDNVAYGHTHTSTAAM